MLIAGVLALYICKAGAVVPVVDTAAISQLLNQVKSLAAQIQMMQQNLAVLGQYNWNDIDGSARQVANVLDEAGALSYASQNIDQQFRQYYPGYKPNADYTHQYQTLFSQTLNSVSGSLKALNMSYNQFKSDAIRLKAMQSQAQGANGALKAIQVNAEIASEIVSQVSDLKSIMMAQATAQQAYISQQAQADATKKANTDAMVNNGATTAPKYGTYKMNTDF